MKLTKQFIVLISLLSFTHVFGAIIPGEFIVRTKTSLKSPFLIFNAQSLIQTADKNLWLVSNTDSQTLRSNSNVIYFEANQSLFLKGKKQSSEINDTRFYDQWAINESLPKNHIDAIKAWTITEGNRNIVIAITDSGIDYNHKDLQGNIWINQIEKNGKSGVDDDANGYVDDIYGFNTQLMNAKVLDDYGHGTHCAGIIGAIKNNNFGIVGIMPKVSLMGIKFFDRDGKGTVAGAIRAIQYAIDMNVQIISASWGGAEESKELEHVIARAGDKGILFVVSAGNSGKNNDDYPTYPTNYAEKYKHVISVAAYDIDTDLATFSNYGIKTVDVSAPGVDILSTIPNNNLLFMSGTSMATPFVSGMLGLMIAAEPNIDILTLKERLKETSYTSRTHEKISSKGRVNAYNFLKNIKPAKPNPNSWINYKLKTPIESKHPYAHGTYNSKFIKIKGAKYIRAIIKEYDLDNGFDFINIRIPDSTVHRITVEEITGRGTNHATKYVEGDTIDISFSTRFTSKGNWGFIVEELQYIKEKNNKAE